MVVLVKKMLGMILMMYMVILTKIVPLVFLEPTLMNFLKLNYIKSRGERFCFKLRKNTLIIRLRCKGNGTGWAKWEKCRPSIFN